MTDLENQALNKAVTDAVNSGVIAKQIIDQLRTGGTSAAMASAPAVVAQVKADIADVEAVLPTIKAGFKTSEFWVTVGVLATIPTLAALGHPLPVTSDAALAAVAMIYTLVRGSVKKAA